MKNRVLIYTGLIGGLLLTPGAAFALGGGGAGANVPTSTFEVSNLGPLNGPWTVQGGMDAFGSIFNNPTSDADINGEGNTGLIGNSGSVSIGEAVIMIHKATGLIHFTYWGGAWQTPAMGITANCPGCGFNSVARFGSATNPSSQPTFKWWFTLQPSTYWSVSSGELASLEGEEIGFDFMNPTFFVSDLNNMQTTPAYGVQLNLFHGPTTLNIQYSDSYKTREINVLSWLLTQNLNVSGSDFVNFFGHANMGHTGLTNGPGGPEINSTLFGVGGQFVAGRWTLIPEAEYQYLPMQAITPGMLSAVGLNPADTPKTTYYNAAAMLDVTYQYTPNWSFTVQPQYIFQNGDKNDPNEYLYGNWLQYGAGSSLVSPSGIGPGTFSPGTSMSGLQVNATWQKKNLFFRPTIAFTHLAGFDPGTGYGEQGDSANQVVGVLEFGILLGKV